MKRALKIIKKFVVLSKILEIKKERHRINEYRKFYNMGRFSYSLSPELIKSDTKIGSFCSIARGVQIGPGKHPLEYLSTSPFTYFLRGNDKNKEIEDETQKITNSKRCIIEDDVWIGTNTVVLEGIRIGRGAVIGANSVVTKDVDPYTIVGGVPAKKIKDRFDEETIREIEKSDWWKYTDDMIIDLPINDISKSLDILEKRIINKRKESVNCCFVISSCIRPVNKPLDYSKVRTAFNVEERLEQTKQTIYSIKKMCPGAHIILVDNGIEDYRNDISSLVDEYYYVGNKFIYKHLSIKNKGIGECAMLLYALKHSKLDYKMLFKISGRYTLDSKFDLAKYDFERINFLNYEGGEVRTVGVAPYKEGSFSTRLYAIPQKYIALYRRALIKAIFFMKVNNSSVEVELAKRMLNEYYYQDELGLKGYIGVDKNLIEE